MIIHSISFWHRFNLEYLTFRNIFRFYHLSNKKKPRKLLTDCNFKILDNKTGGSSSMWDAADKLSGCRKGIDFLTQHAGGERGSSEAGGQALLGRTALQPCCLAARLHSPRAINRQGQLGTHTERDLREGFQYSC